jgi:hypothetical protein
MALENVFNTAQLAFSEACRKISTFTPGHLKSFSLKRSTALMNVTLDVEESDEGIDVVRAMDFILDSSALHASSISTASALASIYLKTTDLTKNAAEIISLEAFRLITAKKATKTTNTTVVASKSNTSSLPIVTDVDWTLGVSIGSSNSSTIQSPIVSILLHVKNPDGSAQIKGVEMSVQEMKALEATLDEAYIALERA